jgi:hypothetical protein
MLSPSETSINSRDPRLMRDHSWLSKQDGRPKTAQTNIILKENFAPTHLIEERSQRLPTKDLKWPRLAIIPRSFRNQSHVVTERNKLRRQQRRSRLDATHIG